MAAMNEPSEPELVAFLGRYAGVPFCSHCLAHEVAVSRGRVDQWIRPLAGVDVVTERRWCVRCFRQTETVRLHPRIERSAG